MAELSSNDLKVWQHASLNAMQEADLDQGGMHMIRVGNDQLAVQLQGFPPLKGNGDTVLVCFSGAVTGHRDKVGPVFSGLGLAKRMGLPLLAIADPTITRDVELTLAWYAGHKGCPNLASDIAALLDGLVFKHGWRLVLFGGSGGGFAALAVQSRMRMVCAATALVWNPQTSISVYLPDAVTSYLASAYGWSAPSGATAKAPTDAVYREALREALEATGTTHSLMGLRPPVGSPVLYLQNRSDWHVAQHAAPYLANGSWRRLKSSSFHCADRDLACFFGDWGVGHVAPPAQLIEEALRYLCAGESVAGVARKLDVEDPEPSKSFVWFAADGSKDNYSFEASLKDGTIYVTLAGAAAHNEPMQFAYYLFADEVRVGVRWYEADPCATFVPPVEAGSLRLGAFIKDDLGVTLSYPVHMLTTPK